MLVAEIEMHIFGVLRQPAHPALDLRCPPGNRWQLAADGWTNHRRARYRRGMSIIATIMNTVTGLPIQKMTFGRMPKPWATFNLATGELVSAERVQVGKPAPGKFITPVDVWVTVKTRD
jgi:hypothetical protein